MYLMNPATALDLAHYRIDQDVARAEAHRLAREAKTARKAERASTAPRRPRRRRAAVRAATALRLGH